ncbi:MAG: 16S rRNA (guanine(966)-N(2))-methyltransferase RsmD, partial [Anaerovorax sp.]
NQIRPTTDKVKEAIFSMIAGNVPDAVAVDLFAGSGNLGLEALSRGAARCYFGDSSKDSLMLAKENINICNAQDKAILLAGDFQKILSRINEKVDIIFLDPPYKKGFMEDCLRLISEGDKLRSDGIIVAEHDPREELPEQFFNYEKIKSKKYGNIMVSIYG